LRPRIIPTFLVLLALLAASGSGQEEAVIRVSSNLVTVPVSVSDTGGEPVRNLGREDFRIEVEGRPQQVVSLGEPGKTPIDLALLLDVSGSVHGRFAFELQAASNFLRMVLKPGDTVAVFTIGDETRLVQAKTSNVEAASANLLALVPTKEATAFFDTVVDVARYMARSANPGTRRVLLVISDGEDNHSERHRLADTLLELQRSDCLFYSINPSGAAIHLNPISMKGQEAMTSLAAETGGAFVPATHDELETVLRRIATELQAQYLLGFYSRDVRADGAFRRIAVRVPNRPELRVRARRGYFAPKG